MSTWKELDRDKKRTWLDTTDMQLGTLVPEDSGWTVSEPERHENWTTEHMMTFTYGEVCINVWVARHETSVMLRLSCCGQAIDSHLADTALICGKCARVIPWTRSNADFTFPSEVGMGQDQLDQIESWLTRVEPDPLRALIAVTDFCIHLSEGQELIS